ncbi:MAG: cell division protein ZapA [Anaplasma sp.]
MLSTSARVVDVVIRGSAYKVACKEDEAQRLGELAGRLSGLIEAISGGGKSSKASDTLLLLLAGLKLEDRVEELSHELEKTNEELSEYKAMHSKEVQVRSFLESLVNYSLSRVRKLMIHVSGESMGQAIIDEDEIVE